MRVAKLIFYFLPLCCYSAFIHAVESKWYRVEIYHFEQTVQPEHNRDLPTLMQPTKLLNAIELSNYNSETLTPFQRLPESIDFTEELREITKNNALVFLSHDAWIQPNSVEPINIKFQIPVDQRRLTSLLSIHSKSPNFLVDLQLFHGTESTEQTQLLPMFQASRSIGQNELHFFQLDHYLILLSITPYF